MDIDSITDAKLQQFFNSAKESEENCSKMVDWETNEPKVFYHNTNSEFTIFDEQFNGTNTDAGWLGDGFYFYGVYEEGFGYGKNKMEVFLNIRTPYYATQEENERLAEANSREVSIEFREEVESEGCDGVYYNGDLRQEVVVYNSTQIKSATDNIGTFDKNNKDIRFHKVEDKATIERLEGEKKVKVYRAMQMQDGKLYPPMSAKERNGVKETTNTTKNSIEMHHNERAEKFSNLNKQAIALEKEVADELHNAQQNVVDRLIKNINIEVVSLSGEELKYVY